MEERSRGVGKLRRRLRSAPTLAPPDLADTESETPAAHNQNLQDVESSIPSANDKPVVKASPIDEVTYGVELVGKDEQPLQLLERETLCKELDELD